MIIKIEDGYLEGREGTDFDGNKYFSFQGIPYAKPPVGELRFKAPQLPEPWPHVRDATKEGNCALSKHMLTAKPSGSEDCLFINVYTRNLPSEKLLPVMVWIHGGGFICGSGNTDLYGPEYLLTQNVVVVSFNYRLGILGFLSLEDESLEVPGNAGLKDQVLALKWVQKNISQFGGDPSNVTIFGHSAGSASVGYLILSPTAKGLFHKAIGLSGTPLSCWALGTRSGRQIASTLGFNSSNEKEILKFLQRQPAEKFLQVQDILKDTTIPCIPRYYGPVIEKPNTTAFITENALDLYKSGKYNHVPYILGYNSEESIFLDCFQEIMISRKFTDFEEAIPYELGLVKGSKESKNLAEKIKKFYFGEGDTDPSNEKNLIQHYKLLSDVVNTKDVTKLAKIMRSTSSQPVYLYRFSAETQLNLFKILSKTKIPGASHGDELSYIFKVADGAEVIPGSIEDLSIRRVVRLLANFARTGNPTPKGGDGDLQEWQPLKEGATNFLDIGNEVKMYPSVPEIDRINFWGDIYRSLNK